MDATTTSFPRPHDSQGASVGTNPAVFAPTTSMASTNNNNNSNNHCPPQEGNTGAAGGVHRTVEKLFRERIQPQLELEQLQRRKEQAGTALRNLGSQIQKINLGHLIEKMEKDQGLADSLERFNERMKEEVERQEIRRESEGRAIVVIQTHMDEFLQQHPHGSYEEWIQDLHPENAHQGKLLNDIQQIDERFYVFGSDHRRLWNQAIGDIDVHRVVHARTQVWGASNTGTGSSSSSSDGNNVMRGEPIDLLSGDNDDFQLLPPATVVDGTSEEGTIQTDTKISTTTTTIAAHEDEFDFFAPSIASEIPNVLTTTTAPADCISRLVDDGSDNDKVDPWDDLIKF
jgi:hypothetical protein